MGKAIGIDLGEHSVTAAIADGDKVRVLYTRENLSCTRAVVGLRRRKAREDEIVVGDLALNNWPMAPKDTIFSIKRLMGRGVDDPEVSRMRAHGLYEIVPPADGTTDSVRVVMGGKQYSPVQISAMILRKVKEDAEFRLGEEVSDAVITVPCYFNQAQNAATRRAAQKAGLRVIQLLNEPTAATIGSGMNSAESTEPKYILVYDLGDGTFDTSVLLWDQTAFVPMSIEGDLWLGSDHFAQVLVDYAVGRIQMEDGVDPRGNLRFMALLKRQAQEVMESFGGTRIAEIIVAGVLQDDEGNLLDVDLEVSREQFEDMIRPLVARTISLTEKALVGAGVEADQVALVLMVGKATLVPLIQQEVEKKFGAAKIVRQAHREHCVAMGAAKLAAVLSGKLVCQQCGHLNNHDSAQCVRCGAPQDVPKKAAPPDEFIPPGGIAPYSYGIQTAGDKYSVFINKKDPFPTPEENRQPQTFYTLMPNQRIFMVPIYGGDNVQQASSNEKQGDVVAILPPGLPKGAAIRVCVWLDIAGVFLLCAHLEGGTDLKPWIMKGEADAKALERLQQVDQAFGRIENELTDAEHAEVERMRNEAFDEMRSKRFDEAAQRTLVLQRKLEQKGQGRYLLAQPDVSNDTPTGKGAK